MKYAFFQGCKIPYYLPNYGISSRAVLNAFDIELIDLEFNCCGYPVRHLSLEASVLSAAKNIAMCEKLGLNIVTPCKCCFGNLKQSDFFLKEDSSLQKSVNSKLSEDGLEWNGKVEIKHLLSVLHDDVGIDSIKNKIKKPLSGVKIAANYGCHSLRPSRILNFDNPMAPTIFEELIEATGATTVDWLKRLDCCGNPLKDKNDKLSLFLTKEKLDDATQSGAKFLCNACTYCQIQFDYIKDDNQENQVSSVLYSDILAESLGLICGN
ncbi:MAG: CoB--CoM heterodisulfide reductase iron-sulfur subunit B family protein [Desulfobacterales bacterium]|nr:CoB--CoM heterodisulfide reductase iron-sulfur subunit B family protein [Desulfobacterales bacterium]